MKKRLSPFLLIGIFVMLPIAVWATEVSVTEVSDTNTKVFYNELDGNSYPVSPAGGPTGWNNDPNFNESGWSPAILFMDKTWLDPKGTIPFQDAGAEWISISKDGKGPDVEQSDGSRGVYLYRKTFQVPATAYNIYGEVGIAADNYGWLYLNGEEVLAPRDLTENDKNFEAPASAGIIGIEQVDKLVCNNVLAAEVQNGCGNCGGTSSVKNGVTGVVFSMVLDYELPDVVWRPPVSNSNFSLKNGSTLPLKFRLFTQEGLLIKSALDIYLAVHEGGFVEPLGNVVAGWVLGRGVNSLRFAKGAGQYIANFQTNKKKLQNGLYTAVVHDLCTDEALGYIEFQLSSQKKHQ